MTLFAQILLFTALAGVLSMIGGLVLLGRSSWVKKFSIHFVSFAAGALLGTAFLELLPEALEQSYQLHNKVLSTALVSLVAFFFFEQLILRFHRHYHEETPAHRHATPTLLMAGDALHNFIDGVVITSSFLASPALGAVTAMAVAAHELPQEMGDFSILLNHNWSKKKVLLVNFLVSLTSIAGAMLAFLLRETLTPLLPSLLALTAGIFIYIAASDLIPEISAETSSDKIGHVMILLLAGIGAVWLFSHYLGV